MSSQSVNLVSVNTAPDRAKKVIGAVIDNVKDKYTIVHAGNSTSEWCWEACLVLDGCAGGGVESCRLHKAGG